MQEILFLGGKTPDILGFFYTSAEIHSFSFGTKVANIQDFFFLKYPEFQ